MSKFDFTSHFKKRKTPLIQEIDVDDSSRHLESNKTINVDNRKPRRKKETKPERKKICIEIPLELYKRTKIASVMTEQYFQVIVAEALKKELDRLGIPPVKGKE